MMSSVVITATVGEEHLVDALASVQDQTWEKTRHLVVVDGPEFEDQVRGALRKAPIRRVPVDVMVLPKNTGRNGFFCHRILAAISFLVDEDVILILDSDNTFDRDHIHKCLKALEWSGLGWCYTLRRMILSDGTYLCDDDAESLGYWMRYIAYLAGTGCLSEGEDQFYRQHQHLVDTNCFAVRREVFMRWASRWHVGPYADAVFAKALLENEPGATTGEVSVSYRLSERNTAKYMLRANEFMRDLFKGRPLPWRVRGTAPGIIPSRALIGMTHYRAGVPTGTSCD